MREILLYAAVVAILLPLPLQAKEVTTWSFLQEEVPGSWKVTNLTNAIPTVSGLHMVTTEDGHLTRATDLLHSVDAIRITVQSLHPTEALFLWHERGFPEEEFVQLPFLTPGRGESATVGLNVAKYPQWDPWTDRIGFAFPAGTDVLLQEVQFVQWNIFEKSLEAWRSFWTFDTFEIRSINFLWGPLLTTNPIAREQMFASSPPSATSANRVYYALIGIIVGALLLMQRKVPKLLPPRKAFTLFLSFLALLWLSYDLRMGLELLSYRNEGVRGGLGQRQRSASIPIYRDLAHAVETIKPTLSTEKQYAFLAPHTGLFRFVRYLTYPSLPLSREEDTEEVRHWFVFKIPDLSLNPRGELQDRSGVTLTPPGRITQRLDEGSFLFERL